MRRLIIWLGIFALAVWATMRILRSLDDTRTDALPRVSPNDAIQPISADAPPATDALPRVSPNDALPPISPDDAIPPVAAPGDLMIKAYCARCRERQILTDVREETTATGRRAARGACSVCGTTVFTFLPAKPSVAGG